MFDEYKCKNPLQNISKPNPTIYKKADYDLAKFIQGMKGRFSIHKSNNVIYQKKTKNNKKKNNVIYHTNIRNDKNHIII